MSYFFLIVLPEISEGLPEFPAHLRWFEYLFVLVGFAFIHINEKIILQKVEAHSQQEMRKLVQMEKNLKVVEKNITMTLTTEICCEKLDNLALKELGQIISSLNEHGEKIKSEIEKYKLIVAKHINKDLNDLRTYTKVFYYTCIGIILFSLLIVELF